jgi:hypothetical protein
MATTDNQFFAEGDNPARMTAFETIAPSLERVPLFGVAVYAKKCGVNAVGVSLTTLAGLGHDPHLIAPDGIGVRGLGDSEGVQGEGPIGVRGLGRVPGTLGSGIGVQGEGVDVGVRGDGTAAGVRGKGNIGVQGEGGDAGVEGKGTDGVRGIGQSPSGGPGTGVRGTGDTGVEGVGRTGVRGQGRDIGVLGESRQNRAGVFHTGRDDLPPVERFDSEPSAQLLLVPVQVDGPAQAGLPRKGLAGDLLAIVSTQRKDMAAELWFCLISGSDDPGQPGATWSQVQFSTTVAVP